VKPLADQDHYEALDVPRGATREEIERAYHLARVTYADDSLAGYSVFQEGEAPLLRDRLELAYRTLADADARRAYDAELDLELRRTSHEHEHEPEAQREAAPAVSESFGVSMLAPPRVLVSERVEEDPDEDQAEYDGQRLQRERIRRGIEIDEIAGVTKVNPTYLRFIEEERFDDLPAAVYLRGFLKCYARCIGLDPDRVAQSYMSRYDERSTKRKRGLFSRRG
jgi:flagellar biosynthesis protein FlhG